MGPTKYWSGITDTKEGDIIISLPNYGTKESKWKEIGLDDNRVLGNEPKLATSIIVWQQHVNQIQ